MKEVIATVIEVNIETMDIADSTNPATTSDDCTSFYTQREFSFIGEFRIYQNIN